MAPFRKWAKTLLFLLVYIFSGLSLVIIIDGLVTGTELTPFNTAVEDAIVHIRTPLLTNIMIGVTNLGSPFVLSCIAIILAVALILRNETYDALLFIISMLAAMASLVILKNTFQLARPDAALVGISGWSFPSGHATMATSFFFAAAYTFFDWFENPINKAILVTSCILCGGVICFSRVYLGAHWSLDILAGIALGLLSVSFVALLFNIFTNDDKFLRRKSGMVR